MQVSTRTGIEHEETLLYESAARETSLNTQIVEFEIENKQIKVELERLKNEKFSAMAELTKIQKASELLDHELKTVKGEMKEYRFRETRLLTDYSELEEENVALQKQVNLFSFELLNYSCWTLVTIFTLGVKFEEHHCGI